MSATLRTIGILGMLLFGTLLSVTFVSPGKAEESAKDFIQFQIEKELRSKHSAVTGLAAKDSVLTIAARLDLEKEKERLGFDIYYRARDAYNDARADLPGTQIRRDQAREQTLASIRRLRG